MKRFFVGLVGIVVWAAALNIVLWLLGLELTWRLMVLIAATNLMTNIIDAVEKRIS
jgi:uncharacterized membrane protein YpjA